VAGLGGFEPLNVSLTKCLAHQQNLVALPKLFEARSEIAFCEFESSQPSHGVSLSSPFELRNVALRAPYFHSGQVWSLKQAVGIMGASQLGQRLTDQEEDTIVAFLQTLTGKQPKVELPILPPGPTSRRCPSNER
jgi:hypothetical protein